MSYSDKQKQYFTVLHVVRESGKRMQLQQRVINSETGVSLCGRHRLTGRSDAEGDYVECAISASYTADYFFSLQNAAFINRECFCMFFFLFQVLRANLYVAYIALKVRLIRVFLQCNKNFICLLQRSRATLHSEVNFDA